MTFSFSIPPNSYSPTRNIDNNTENSTSRKCKTNRQSLGLRPIVLDPDGCPLYSVSDKVKKWTSSEIISNRYFELKSSTNFNRVPILYTLNNTTRGYGWLKRAGASYEIKTAANTSVSLSGVQELSLQIVHREDILSSVDLPDGIGLLDFSQDLAFSNSQKKYFEKIRGLSSSFWNILPNNFIEIPVARQFLGCSNRFGIGIYTYNSGQTTVEEQADNGRCIGAYGSTYSMKIDNSFTPTYTNGSVKNNSIVPSGRCTAHEQATGFFKDYRKNQPLSVCQSQNNGVSPCYKTTKYRCLP